MGGEEQPARLSAGRVANVAAWVVGAMICGPAESAAEWHFDAQGRAQVDIQYDCATAAPIQALTGLGFVAGASVKFARWCVIEGWLPADSLGSVPSIAGVRRVGAPAYAVRPRLSPAVHPFIRLNPRVGAGSGGGGIDQGGVSILRADQFVGQTGTSGIGVKVGVQSSGVSSLQTIRTRGELPNVQLLMPADGAPSPTGDEGTALLEEVHAIAPGAALAYCGPGTFVEYTSCLGQMINAGASILVDDLIFPQEDLLSADSPGVQAIEQLLTDNPQVLMFTAGGNYNGSYWEGNYSPVPVASVGLGPLTCATGSFSQTDNYVTQFDSVGAANQLLVKQSSSIPLELTWGDPPDHNASRYDVYWFIGTTQMGCLSTAAEALPRVSENIAFTATTYTLYIGTPDASGAGQFLKLWLGGDGLTSLSKSTSGGVVSPQALAAGVVTVGAVNGSDGIGNTIEPFSSTGPISVMFPAAAQIQAPVLVAPDGINVDAAGTYFQGNLFPDGNFYGTSAAAPNAAGVAALIRGAFPGLTATQLVASLKAGAVQLGTLSPDGIFGYGRVDALGTLGTFPSPTMTSLPDSSLTAGTSSSAYPFTVTGSGPLHFTVTSSNSSSIPAAVVPAGSPGVTIAPADCGINTLSCTASVMPANGPSATVTVTVAAVDGANRSATASMKVTVAGTQAAPPNESTSPPAAGSGGGGGGSLQWPTLATLLLLRMWPRVRLRRGPQSESAGGRLGYVPGTGSIRLASLGDLFAYRRRLTCHVTIRSDG